MQDTRRHVHLSSSSSCTAIVARPLSYSCTPRPTLNSICKRSQGLSRISSGERRGDSIHHHFPSLSLFLRLLRKMQVATVTCRVRSPFFHLSSFVHTAAQTHLFAHLHRAQFCSAHAIPAIMSHLLVALHRLRFPSSLSLLIFYSDGRVGQTWIDVALGSSLCFASGSPVVCGIVGHVSSGVESKRQAAAVARLRLL